MSGATTDADAVDAALEIPAWAVPIRRYPIVLERSGWQEIYACAGKAGAFLADVVAPGAPDDLIAVAKDMTEWNAVQRAILSAGITSLCAGWGWPVSASVQAAFDAQMTAGLESVRRVLAAESERVEAQLERFHTGLAAPSSRLH